ncbi:MAG: LLM class F420-dependent oxidoreductase [Pseudomonadales bacterium]
MRFSCSLPVANDFSSIENISDAVNAIDNAGFASVFVTDHPAPTQRWLEGGGHPTLDPFVALSVAATASVRIRLHTHVLVLAYRNPFVVAKAAASLDRLCGGRLTLGIGTGYMKAEYNAVGVPFEERGELTNEAIEILRRAWAGEPIDYKGKRFKAVGTCVLPTPAQSPLPIWAGGNAPAAIRRAVAMCEGWSPFYATGAVSRSTKTHELASIAQLRGKIEFAHEFADKIGRAEPLEICMGIIGDNAIKPHASEEAARLVDEYWKLIEAGVSWTTMSLPSPSLASFIENAQWFGEEVISKLPKEIVMNE